LLVDPEDRHIIEARMWQVHWTGYVACTFRQEPNGKPVFKKLHRVIMNAPPRTPIDHINGNKLDNRKANLRYVTPAVNSQNRDWMAVKKSSKSGVRNVFKRINKHGTVSYLAKIGAFRKMHYGTPRRTIEEAVADVHALRAKFWPDKMGSGQ
jgi:hypothetical protein